MTFPDGGIAPLGDGINDRFRKDVAASLQAGSAALFLLIRKMTTDEVFADLKGVGGKVLRTSLTTAKRRPCVQHWRRQRQPSPALVWLLDWYVCEMKWLLPRPNHAVRFNKAAGRLYWDIRDAGLADS